MSRGEVMGSHDETGRPVSTPHKVFGHFALLHEQSKPTDPCCSLAKRGEVGPAGLTFDRIFLYAILNDTKQNLKD